MVDDFIAQRARDFLLQLFYLVRMKFNDVTTFHINDMVMMFSTGLLETRRAAIERMAMNSSPLFQQFHRAINSRERDISVNLHRSPENLQRVGMVFGFCQDIDDDAAWSRYAYARIPQFLLIIWLAIHRVHFVIMHLSAVSCNFSQLESTEITLSTARNFEKHRFQ